MNDNYNKQSSYYQLPSARTPRACSYCGKVFSTLYALGGHMTAHRVEMEQMRREHVASTETAGTAIGAATVRWAGSAGRPRMVDFMGLGSSTGRAGDVHQEEEEEEEEEEEDSCGAGKKKPSWGVGGDDNGKGKALDLDLSLKL